MKTVLFFIESTRNSCAEQLEGIFRHARHAAWHVQLVECGGKAVDVARFVREWNPVGVIVEYSSVVAGLVPVRDLGQVPAVYLDYDPSFGRTHHMVAPDSDEIAQLALRELFSLGFEHYAYVPFAVPYYWSNRRQAAFRRLVRTAGKKAHVFDRASEVPLGDWLKALPKPCGLFAANDRVSEEVVGAALLQGLRIPEDLAVIGVDGDEKICMNANLSLSSVQLDFIQAGYLAASRLHDLVRGRLGRSGLWTFEPLRVIRRQSTARGSVHADRDQPRDIGRVTEFLKTSAGNGVTVADVVNLMGCSRRSAEQRFKRQTGRTILEAIHDGIFARACEFAADRHVRTQHVSDFLGAISRDTLDRIFIRRTGKTFRAWRNTPASVSSEQRTSVDRRKARAKEGR